MNELSIAATWQQGDWVTRVTAVILLAMSVASWTVILFKWLQLSRLGRMGIPTRHQFWEAKSWNEAIDTLGRRTNNPFYALAAAGFAANQRQRQSKDSQSSLEPSVWLGRCLKDVLEDTQENLQSGLAILASVGSTAPFVGLFGTVWGIFHALQAIGLSGQASLSQVAGPVGEALVMTAFGLAVAIPAVLGYNALNRRTRALGNRLNRFASSLFTFFLTGSRLAVEAGNESSQNWDLPTSLSVPT